MRYLNKPAPLVLFIVILMLSSVSFSKSNSYRIKVESISQNTTTINQDIELAFQTLEQQLTHESKSSKPSYDKISPLIEQYQYIEENNKQFLLIDFDKQATKTYLKQHNITQKQPITDNTLLLYVAQQVGKNQTLLDTETDNPIIDTISAEAFKEGIHLISPATDLNDINTVSFEDVWPPNIAVLKSSASRYQTKGILVVLLKRNDGEEWTSNWHLYQSDHHNEFRAANAPIAQLSQQAIQNIKLQQQKNATHTVQNINIEAMHQNSQNNYQNTLNILKTTPGILSVQIESVTPDSVFYKLSINKDKDELINRLKGHKNISQIRVSP